MENFGMGCIRYGNTQPHVDLDKMKNILPKLKPSSCSFQKTVRIGKKLGDHSRSLCVILYSKDEAISILRAKSTCAGLGSVKIVQDQTPKQREHLSELRRQLKSLIDSGVTDKTVHYVNGVPKIINVNSNIKEKTGCVPISILPESTWT